MNVWYHLAYTYDGTTHRIYVNGANTNSKVDAGGAADTASNLFLGAGGINFRLFPGLIDEVRIYGQALASAQIQKHYAEGLGNIRTLLRKNLDFSLHSKFKI